MEFPGSAIPLLLYYITDRTQFPGDERTQRRLLLEKVAETAGCGVDFIQLREKNLNSRELEGLARAAVEAVRSGSSSTRFLINSRTDVALGCGADGVHLRSEDVRPSVVRKVWSEGHPVVGVSCHSIDEVKSAAGDGADFAVFAPVFEKDGRAGVGIARLREACEVGIPVIALGGVSLENAAECIHAGAAGVAGIRLFQAKSVRETVDRLRSLRRFGGCD